MKSPTLIQVLLYAGAAALTLLASLPIHAYERSTHVEITKAAILRSVLNNQNILYRLGLFPTVDESYVRTPGMDIYSTDCGGCPSPVDIVIWYAAHKEDDGRRSLQHFFDPINDRGLQVHSIFSPGQYTTVGVRSNQWALGLSRTDTPYLDPPSQKWSLRDANEYLVEAITSETKEDRDRNYGKYFAAMGHVLHHVQDMAQPDHVRNDSHCDALLECGVIGELLSTDAIFDPSAYERQVRAAGYGSFNSWDYSMPVFGSYRDYWSNEQGMGISDFTNRFAVSPTTNFRNTFDGIETHPEFALPSGANALLDEEQMQVALIDGMLVTFFTTVLRSPYYDAVQQSELLYDHETSRYSIYEPDLVTAELAGTDIDQLGRAWFTLDYSNYQSAAYHLLPRAEAYSAGFINYMLRGQMGVRISERGYYAAADHADGEGFRQIRVQLRNETPTITPPVGDPVTQHMGQGEIVAVASYRENPCYTDDLKGDPHLAEDGTGYFPGGCNWETWMSGEEIHIVSEPVAVMGISTNWTEMLFDFSANPIPFSALDLELFFVFRGELGNEADDIVVARHDISEPTYMGFVNSTDLYWQIDEWIPAETVLDNGWAGDDDRAPQILDVEWFLEDFRVAFAPLTPGKHQRFAVLVDVDDYANFRLGLQYELWEDGRSDMLDWPINPTLNQTRPALVQLGQHGESSLSIYVEQWCDPAGCTLSGLDLDRGVSGWGNQEMWFWQGFYPTEEQIDSREPMEPTAIEGMVVVD